MTTQTDMAIDAMVALIQLKTKELAELKRATNALCHQIKRPDMFADMEDDIGMGMQRVKPDQFYGRTPIVAAREYLEMRHEAARPEEILEALSRGGFDFDSQNWPEKDRLRSLAISLSKNSAIFHKLPQGTYGLLKWYPDKKERSDEAGKPASKKAQPKAQPKPKAQPRVKAKPSSQPSAPRQQERGGSPPVNAVQQAIGKLSGRFTIDEVLPRLEESERERAKVRIELNRLAHEDGTGIRVVTKGGINRPAVYEISDPDAPER